MGQEDIGVNHECADVLDTFHVLKRAGIALPAEEVFTIGLTMKELAATKTLTRLR